MVVVLLAMMAAGVGLAQAVQDPNQVTLRWLRLGGILALTLLAVAATIHVGSRDAGVWAAAWPGLAAAAACFTAQLLAVQMARGGLQRSAAIAAFAIGALTAAASVHGIMGLGNWGAIGQNVAWISAVLVGPLMCVLLGGFVMTMLLGHAYLTAGTEMTQRPLRRLVAVLAVALVLRAAGSLLLGLLPYLADAPDSAGRTWVLVMISARYGAGLAVPGVFTYMIHDCVKRAANQSATGILYVASVLVIVGEGTALTLMSRTGLAF